jgi:hypothetical protein
VVERDEKGKIRGTDLRHFKNTKPRHIKKGEALRRAFAPATIEEDDRFTEASL